MAVFLESLTLRLPSSDVDRAAALATRMQMPLASVGRLLLLIGLERVAADPSALMLPPAQEKTAPGLPVGTRTRSGGGAA